MPRDTYLRHAFVVGIGDDIQQFFDTLAANRPMIPNSAVHVGPGDRLGYGLGVSGIVLLSFEPQASMPIKHGGNFSKNARTWRRFNCRRITTRPSASTAMDLED